MVATTMNTQLLTEQGFQTVASAHTLP